MSGEVEFHRAQDAEERGEGICRTCLHPIWNEGGTVGHRKVAEGWSDRIERGGDSLVCFKAVEYRHVPLTTREAAIYDRAYERGVSESTVATAANACQNETFIGREPIEDERGEPTGKWKVMALCNGAIRSDCGWDKRLTEHDRDTSDWWITNEEMDVLHAEHMAYARPAPSGEAAEPTTTNRGES